MVMIINYKSIDIIIIIVHYIGGPRIDFLLLQDYLFYIWQFALKYWRRGEDVAMVLLKTMGV